MSLSSKPLPATSYNRIPLIQDCLPIDQQDINRLALIFIDSGVHKHFSLSRLHRHQYLTGDEVMVHSRSETGQDLCRKQPYRQDLHPSLWSWCDKAYRPCEYSIENQPEPDNGLFTNVAQYLVLHGLENALAISHITSHDGPWTERLLEDGSGTVSSPLDAELHIDSESIVTEWQFWSECGNAKVRALKECKQGPSGGHRVE